jgi:hypothetical protein
LGFSSTASSTKCFTKGFDTLDLKASINGGGKRKSRPYWYRPLPRPLVIPGVMKIVTLADVRDLIEQRLPQHFRAKTTWRYVAAKLKQAARGADAPQVPSLVYSQFQAAR